MLSVLPGPVTHQWHTKTSISVHMVRSHESFAGQFLYARHAWQPHHIKTAFMSGRMLLHSDHTTPLEDAVYHHSAQHQPLLAPPAGKDSNPPDHRTPFKAPIVESRKRSSKSTTKGEIVYTDKFHQILYTFFFIKYQFHIQVHRMRLCSEKTEVPRQSMQYCQLSSSRIQQLG